MLEWSFFPAQGEHAHAARPPHSTNHSRQRREIAVAGHSRFPLIWPRSGSAHPHRQRAFKLSTYPNLAEKVIDIVGLYMNPPYNTLVLCVDEKTQMQALQRTQPMLPLGLDYIGGVNHDYKRHGTTPWFAALNVASGEVLTQCRKRHRHHEFLAFLKHIDDSVPKDKEIHLIIDNYCTHKHAKVKQWFEQRPCYKVQFTPTYSSWLNQVERFFGIITQQAIRHSSVSSVKQLIASKTFKLYNTKASPFVWLATAAAILAKFERLRKVVSRQS